MTSRPMTSCFSPVGVSSERNLSNSIPVSVFFGGDAAFGPTNIIWASKCAMHGAGCKME